MADGGGSGGGGEGGGSADWLPIFDRVEAQVEALAADRARQEAADRVQRESWEAARWLQRSVEELLAAAREKEAEIDRLRAEAADARKKLQADASRRGRWEAAYMELILGANQKLAELRESDLEDSRTIAENPGFKVYTRNGLHPARYAPAEDHTSSDLRAELRKLKQAYETLSIKKDKKHSALLLEKDSVCNQLSITQQDYAKLLKNNKVESEQATEAAQKLQRNIDELKMLTQKKDHEISILRAEAVGAKKGLPKMHSLVKEKYDEIQRQKRQHPESAQKYNKNISETHIIYRSSDPAITVRDRMENDGIRQTIEEDYISEAKTVENDGQDESTHKRRRATTMSNDDEKSGSDEDDDEQIGSDGHGDKQTGSDDDGDKQTGSDEDGDEQSESGEDSDDDNDELSGSDEETKHNQVQKPLRNPKRKRDACTAQVTSWRWYNLDKGDVMTWLRSWAAPKPLRSKKLDPVCQGRRFYSCTGHWGQYVKAVNDSLVDQPDKHKEFVRFLRNFQNWRAREVARTMEVLLNGQPKLIRQFNRFLPKNCQIYVKKDEEKHQRKHEPGVHRQIRQLSSSSAAAGLIKLKGDKLKGDRTAAQVGAVVALRGGQVFQRR